MNALKDYWQTFYELSKRKGVTESYARLEVRRRNTLIGCLMVCFQRGMLTAYFAVWWVTLVRTYTLLMR
jgi:hypothetical protein